MWLKKKPAAAQAEAGAHPVSGCRILCSLLWKLGLAALLVYGALQLLVRTGYFRSRVEAELSRLAGLEMRVGRVRSSESLNLKFNDVISVSEFAGIEARTVRVRWRLFRPRGAPLLESVRVDGLALTIAPDKNGVIQPAFLGKFSRQIFKWAGVSLPEGAPETARASTPGGAAEKTAEVVELGVGRDLVPLTLQRVSLRWEDAAGQLLAAVSGLDLSWTSMELPNGSRLAHVDCRAAEVKMTSGPRITGLHVELIDAGERQFLMALEAADWGSAQPPPAAGTESLELLRSME